ncbi:hypothetical protein [Nonlabens sp.]|uniref:hypothetical protein n=1 Tax=Nonlabens sp. TaxID=1888209 RepID=UPI00326356CA
MFTNKQNRASLKARLIYTITVTVIFTCIMESYDYFFDDEPFDLKASLLSSLLFGVLLFLMSYFTLKAKK